MEFSVKKVSEIKGVIKAPPSKSYSHRAVIIASLASGKSKIYNMLYSDDTIASIKACKLLGAKISKKSEYLEVIGTRGLLHNISENPIDLANSGTSLRLITSIASLSDNEVYLTGDDSLKMRPMESLILALKPLGVKVKSLKNNFKAPLKIYPGFIGGRTFIQGNISSQFISSILISSPLSKNGVILNVLPEFKSKPYVDMTVDIMSKFGVDVLEEKFIKHEDCNKEIQACSFLSYEITPQLYKSFDYIVEGDYSSASYLLSAVAIFGGKIKILNLFKDSKQGDKLILDILKEMGAEIIINDDNVIISSDGLLKGININLSHAPDLLITVAVLGSLAEGTTKITGVNHARFKETDRIANTCSELRKLGCKVEELEDGLIIKGGVSSGTVDSHNDHRLAMAFSLIGLKHEVYVKNAEFFNISFPNFIEAMEEIGVELALKED